MWNSKPKKATCNCRRKAKGNPKVGGGVCYHNLAYREVVQDRIRDKRAAKAALEALNAGVDADDLDI